MNKLLIDIGHKLAGFLLTTIKCDGQRWADKDDKNTDNAI